MVTSVRPVRDFANDATFPRLMRLDRKPIAILCAAVFALTAADAGTVGFNRDVRPILSEKCYHCHGPDAKQRKADLRLDVPEVAMKSGAIVPGHPEKSEMIGRILTTDSDDHMPPAKAKMSPLSATEIETLKKWIAEGAEYEPHWAFIPLKPAAAP